MKSARASNEQIAAPILILVEGQDEKYFLPRMCEHWFQGNASKFDIECVGGSDKFAAAFRALTVRSLGPLKVVGVIVDSEENPDATRQRWRNLIAEVEPAIKRPCRNLQLPEEQLAGAWESLVLKALGGNPVVGCATSFRDCVVPHISKRTSAQKDKIAVQAWLAAELGGAYANVISAQKWQTEKRKKETPLIDYDHAAFAPIKAFLESLLSEL
jgi:hypothetical protein